MPRKLIVLAILSALIAGATVMPVAAAKKKKQPKPIAVTYHLNWFGDCEGGGYLSAEAVPNPDNCALFFPGIVDTYSFPASEGSAFSLDATQPITVDFDLSSAASAATEYEVVVTATIAGEEKQIASGTQMVLAAAYGITPVHYELEPDAAFDKATVATLTATVSWVSGMTYSKIDLDSGTATITTHGFK